MKEILKTGKMMDELGGEARLMGLLYHIAACAAGFAASRGVVLSGLLPFGLSAVAGCPQVYLPTVSIGAFLGYFIPAVGSGGFRYIAALVAILAIRIMISGYRGVAQSSLFLSGINLAATLLTAAVTLTGLRADVFEFLAEGLLSAGGTFFIHKAGKGLHSRAAGLSGEELASLLISVNIALLGLSGISVFGITPWRILGVVTVLIAAKYSGVLGGTVSGITLSLFCSLHTAQGGYLLYAVGGMVCGIICHLGKYAQLSAFAAISVITTAITGDFVGFGPIFAEIMLAAVVFATMPRSAGITLNKLFSLCPKPTENNSIKNAVTMRLDMAANALCDVNETVEQVSRELAKINAPDFGRVLSGVEQDACGGCKLRIHCWESRRDATLEAIMQMTKAIKQGEYDAVRFAPDEFHGRCLRAAKVGSAVYKRYSEYTSLIAAESRLDEVRNVVSTQFSGIADMLSTLSIELQNDGFLDNSAAERAAAALCDLEIKTLECYGKVDRYGRMSIELKIQKCDTPLNRMQIMKAVSLACERDFDPPAISEIGGDLFITLNEHAAYRVDLGIGQISAGRSGICGDAYRCFKDGNGHFIAILSDGMGTGGRAAVDGAMASGLMARLLKSGFSYDCALKILNSSMLFKSSDESLATVDIASIDLFTGEAELYKAGAAPTVVRRAGRSGKAVSTSLPIGILGDVGFDRAGIRLRQNDILLLLSDGATCDGTDWIRDELEGWSDGSAEELAEHISDCARRRSRDERADDITVIAAILEKAI